MAALRACLLLLAWGTLVVRAQLGPVYVLTAENNINNTADRDPTNFAVNRASYFSVNEYYEWESFDGWFNNPAHPEWGGAGK